MALEKDVFDTLPEAVQSEYEEKDGKYIHVSEGKALALKESLDNLDKKRKDELSGLQSQIDEINAKKEQEIKDAREASLIEAKSKGDIEAIEKRYQEQMDDLKNRTAQETRAEVEKEFHAKNVDTQITSTAELFSQSAIDDESKPMLEMFAKSRMKNEDGKLIYLNADGSASSITEQKVFLSELKKEQSVKRLIQAETPAGGGGLANGSGGFKSGDKNADRASAVKNKDLNGFLKTIV